MKIFAATDDYIESFDEMFREFGGVQLLPKDPEKAGEIDLLIFTGGEDVHPKFYNSNHHPGNWINEKRDIYELRLMEMYKAKKINVKKILGVCRGMQLINVSMGGSLIFDLAEYMGAVHPHTHEIVWRENTIFSDIFTTVNSLHHQALLSMDGQYPVRVLAREPKTSVVEAALWGNTILGFQFHPEFWRSNMNMAQAQSKTAQGIVDWTTGETNIVVRSKTRPTDLFSSSAKYTVSFSSNSDADIPGEETF
jgi:putative glutamine amidotransferase